MNPTDLITTIEHMTAPELTRLQNAINAIKVEVPKPPAEVGTVILLNDSYLPQEMLAAFQRAAGKAGVIITVTHGSSRGSGQWDGNHGWGDADVKYQDTPEATARMLLAIIDECKKIQRSTLPNPAPRQKLSAATLGMDAGNHGPADNPKAHAHVPTEGGQIIVGEEIRRQLLDAAGGMK